MATQYTPQNNHSPSGFLRLQQVLQRFPVSRSTWWAGVKRGDYPAAVKLSERTSAWHSGDIDALVERTRKSGGAA